MLAPGGIDSAVLTLENGSTATYTGGQLNQLFESVIRSQGRIVAGSFDPTTFPGLVEIVATSGSMSQTALMPTDCGGDLAPLPPVESETPEAPPTTPPGDESPEPIPGERPDDEPDGPDEQEEPDEPRIVGGPPTDTGPDELPATGADLPSRLLMSAFALLLGFALLRMNPPIPANDPGTLNGFRRPSSSSGSA